MPGVELTVVTTGPGLEKVEFASSNLRIPLEQSVRAWRALGSGEFADAAWRPPSGPFRPWAATLDGGKPLKGGGRLLASWLGGAGGIERISDTEAEFGTTLPYAGVHRGEGTAAGSREPFRFKMTSRQRRFLAARAREEGRSFGRRDLTDPNRGFIITPRRPHFTTSPELETRITAIFAAHVGLRQVPQELLEA